MPLEGLTPAAVAKIVDNRVEQIAKKREQQDLLGDVQGELTPISAEWQGDSAALDSSLAQARSDMENAIRNVPPIPKFLDQKEGEVAALLYDAISEHHIPLSVLNDERFWAHLGLAYVWHFTLWRHGPTFDALLHARGKLSSDLATEADDDTQRRKLNFLAYVDGRRSVECVASRLYLRIRCLGGSQYRELASSLTESADFWRSHVFRVKQGSYPGIVRAMIRRQANSDTRLETQQLRAFAKDLNHGLFDFEPALLTDSEHDQMVAGAWEKQLAFRRSVGDE